VNCLRVSPERCSHSDVPLYIPLVIIYTQYTGVRQNDCNVYAYCGWGAQKVANSHSAVVVLSNVTTTMPIRAVHPTPVARATAYGSMARIPPFRVSLSGALACSRFADRKTRALRWTSRGRHRILSRMPDNLYSHSPNRGPLSSH
jgi:hypothetical protein